VTSCLSPAQLGHHSGSRIFFVTQLYGCRYWSTDKWLERTPFIVSEQPRHKWRRLACRLSLSSEAWQRLQIRIVISLLLLRCRNWGECGLHLVSNGCLRTGKPERSRLRQGDEAGSIVGLHRAWVCYWLTHSTVHVCVRGEPRGPELHV
jgi:hypothetical protein